MTQTDRPDFFKTCPVCYAETPPAILNCPICGVNLEFARAKSIENSQSTKNVTTYFKNSPNIPEKKKTPLWLSIIGVIIGCCMLLIVYGIIKDLFILPLTNANTYATPIALPTAKNSSSDDLCTWFLKTQVLRTQRLSGLTEFTKWSLTKDFKSLTHEDILDMVDILVRYQPYQEAFIRDWKSLGPHSQSLEFWELELQSVQLRIESIDAMAASIDRNDGDEFTRAWDTFAQSQSIGNRGESAMQKIRAQCVR